MPALVSRPSNAEEPSLEDVYLKLLNPDGASR